MQLRKCANRKFVYDVKGFQEYFIYITSYLVVIFRTINAGYELTTASCFRFREHEIQYLIRLTDSFTWEELPTTYYDTGYLTKAAYILIIQRITKYLTAFIFGFHGIQSAVRMVMYHDMIFAKWYPFDVSSSPAYEITNLSQVTL
jgi:hypothetical protein